MVVFGEFFGDEMLVVVLYFVVDGFDCIGVV